jgi:site-specific DNA-cytosine methylase
MELVDVFCGGGLFSYAARSAGMKVVFGVDNDSKALETYKANFPEAKVKCASVGPGADADWENEVDIPCPAPNRHMHLSPPCTQISSANTACRDKEYGINALKWAIATGMKYESWSVETVVSKSSHDVVKPLRDEHKTTGLLDFVELDAQMVGDPQTRKRLIIGPHRMINAIKTAPPCRIVSVKEAFDRAKVQIPPGSTHTKNASKSNGDGSNIRPIGHPSFTVCAARANSFCKADGTTTMSMKSYHSRILMGLDESFVLRGKAADTQQVIGNGVCFNVGRAIALAAMKRPITFQAQMHSAVADTSCSDGDSSDEGTGAVPTTLADSILALEKTAKRLREEAHCIECHVKAMRKFV